LKKKNQLLKNHPEVVIKAVGSLGKTFGIAYSLVVGRKLEKLQDALSNTRTDGIDALLSEGAAAYP
jgi:transketolase N-terminal domain/subunit